MGGAQELYVRSEMHPGRHKTGIGKIPEKRPIDRRCGDNRCRGPRYSGARLAAVISRNSAWERQRDHEDPNGRSLWDRQARPRNGSGAFRADGAAELETSAPNRPCYTAESVRRETSRVQEAPTATVSLGIVKAIPIASMPPKWIGRTPKRSDRMRMGEPYGTKKANATRKAAGAGIVRVVPGVLLRRPVPHAGQHVASTWPSVRGPVRIRVEEKHGRDPRP